MADVFLSYSSVDRAMAGRIQQALEGAGFDVFWDQETPPGRDWNSWIGEKLAGAKCVVVLWSKASVASRNVVHEATIAAERKILIPALVADLKSTDYPMGLYTTQGVDLRGYAGGNHPQMARLIAAVGEMTRKAPQSRAPRSVGPSKSLLGFAAAGAALLAGVALFQYLNRPRDAPPEAMIDAPAVVDGVVATSPATELEAIDRLKGHWNWDGLDCAKGPHVTVADNGDIIFTAPDTRFVHEFEGIGADRLSVHTIVKEPESAKGARYILTPLFFATATQPTSDGNEPRTWQLQVQEKDKTGPPDVWDPCDVKPGG